MTAGKYIRRAVIYFIKLIILVILIYLLLFIAGSARVSAEYFFREMFSSYNGPLLITALALLAAFYPKFGYVNRIVKADIVRDREQIITAFHNSNYVMISEVQGERMVFRASSVFRRLWLGFDDKIVVTAGEEGIVLDGIRKVAVNTEFRINTYVQNKRDEE